MEQAAAGVDSVTPSDDAHKARALRRSLALAALGVVYGDIGTSPLYAFQESSVLIARDQAHVLGVLSLFFWSIMLVVVVKYLGFVMRADNHGEGGLMALLALVPAIKPKRPESVGFVALLVLFGTALLFGDGVITPAISVLSAVEGLKMVSTAEGVIATIERLVVPVTCVILVGLFAVQRGGTAKVGRLFGPIMIVWFATLGVLGLVHVVQHSSVLAAVSPTHAFEFLLMGDVKVLAVMGAVMLCITGGEALYADMGHFGRGPIRIAWYSIVLPGLLLNYFGQGALVLDDPDVPHTFWHLVPAGLPTLALVAVSTAATIIASQAMISGSYSLARQAVQLGFFPRVTIVHTSRETEGQIYVPEVNWALMVACIVLVLGFRSSTAIAGAYGIAVTGTMLITSVVFLVVALRTWKWPAWKAVPIVALFCIVDTTFLVSNIHKIPDGGWVSLLIGVFLFTVMLTWKQGKALVAVRTAERTIPLAMLASDLATSEQTRVPGTGVFMAPDPDATPLALLHFFKHAKVLPETVITLSVEVEPVPWVGQDERATVMDLGGGIHNVSLHFGFMQTPNVPSALRRTLEEHHVPFEAGSASYFVGRETLLPTGPGRMMSWRKVLFEVLSRNVPTATAYFRIPPNQVVELGAQIAL